MSNNLVYSPSYFNSDRKYYGDVSEGESLQNIIDKLPISFEMKSELVIYVGGIYIPRDFWPRVFPKQNVAVVIVHLPMGGDDKNPLALIASIAIAFVAPYAAAGLGLTGIAATAVSAGISLVGRLLIGALFPPPSPTNNTPAATQANYNITAQSNSAKNYQSMPRLYGKHKMYPDVIAAPFVRAVGNKEFLHVVYSFGYGNIELSDIRIGETPFENFKNASSEIISDFVNPDNFKWYTQDVNTQGFGILLKKNEIQQIETGLNTDIGIINIAFPSALRTIDKESGASTLTKVQFDLRFREADTLDPWLTLGDVNHIFSRNKVSYDGTTGNIINFKISFETKVKNNSSGIFSQPTVLYDYYANGSSFKISSVSGSQTIFAGSKVKIGGNVYVVQNNVSSGGTMQLDKSIGNILVARDIKTQGPFSVQTVTRIDNSYQVIEFQTPLFTIQENSTKPFTLGLEIEFPYQARWEIELKRTTEYIEGDPSKLYKSILTSLQSITKQNPVTIDKEITTLEIKIKATDQLNGTVNIINAIGESYLDIWDGLNWIIDKTSNPAWIYVDILTGSANNKPISKARLDIDSIYEFAQYCDLKGYTCNFINEGKTTIWELMKNVLSSGRASPSIIDGRYGVIYDEKKSFPVQVFTPRNSRNFRSTRTFIDSPHALQVNFVDPNSNWQQQVRTVYNDGYDENTSAIFEELSLFGITDSDLAWKHGRYFLAEGILRQEIFTIETDIENIICIRGDLVEIQYDIPKVGGIPARIRMIAGNQITIDEIVSNNSDPVCLIRNDESELYNLGYIFISEFVLELNGTIPSGVKVGDLIVTGELDKVTAKYLLSAVLPGEDFSATLSFVPEAIEIYNADQGAIPPWNPIIVQPPQFEVPNLIDFDDISEVVTFFERRPVINFSISWFEPVGVQPSYYDVYLYKDEFDEWEKVGSNIKEQTYMHTPDPQGQGTLVDIVGNEFTYAVVAVNYFGKFLPVESASNISIVAIGDTIRPASPLRLDLDVVDQTIALAWDFVNESDVAGYVIRYDPDIVSTNWNKATKLVDIVSWTSNTVQVNARVGTYFVKTIDTSGNESNDFAIAHTSIPSLNNLNIIAQVIDYPDWNGNFEQMSKFGLDKIWLDQITPNTWFREGKYYFESIIDLGEVYTARCFSYINAYGQGSPFFISEWNLMSDINPLSNTDSSNWDAWTEVRLANTLNTISDWNLMSEIDPISVGGNNNWSPWVPFYAADFTSRVFQFRLVAETFIDGITVVFTNAMIEVDMPDRLDGEFNLFCPSGGIRVIFNPVFKERPVIQITEDASQQGDYFVITNQDNAGFDIMFFDLNGTPIQATFDWMGKGYGRRSLNVINPIPFGVVSKSESKESGQLFKSNRRIQ